MPEIGATLREARMRERIDVSEIEAKTKIRAKYLRALENEEWDLLPGPTFVKSFLRTYAEALGLDSKALLEEYKLHYEHPGEVPELSQQPSNASAARRARARARSGNPTRPQPRRPVPPGGPSRGYLIAVAVVGLVIVLLVVGLLTGGGSPSNTTSTQSSSLHHARRPGAHRGHATTTALPQLASLHLEPSAAVYVCLIGDGRKRIAGTILQPGEHEPTYHAHRFELTLGNNAVTLLVNGTPHTVPASSAAIGYAITATGMRSLTAGEQPTCK